MVVVFANNQVMATPSGTTNTIRTDPVPMNGNDRFSGTYNLHYSFGATTKTLTVTLEGSNDGTNWYTIQAFTDITIPAGNNVLSTSPITAVCAFVRLKFDYTGDDAASFCCFDIHAVLDKS